MARGDGSRLSPRLSPSMSPLPSSAAGSERPGSGVYLASETDDGDSVTDASSVYSDDMVGAWWPQLRRLSSGATMYVLQPFLIGLSGAFGMSVGYALFDRVARAFSKRQPVD
ncbi:hypothetical protein BU14_1900s0002 [Porphyra umbilicalis]|uniref:Uncharacterized protein n=1 Tax=Porphyra umbilicalis TaxID=2786 RepID=A0A1X6NKT0_PORUM|nr:hypothetical protein BU14_1900s0002 [Porphyra umbilicalis]|eukprot:OSX69076.1 hypothetical protein BU14_1900s0002 [Porphyra umbilicalis]